MNGLAQAQRLYDRRLPPMIDELDYEVRCISDLSSHEIEQITEQFIRDLADCDVLHNFMEDAGGLAGDLDACAQLLAQAWLIDAESVSRLVGAKFWQCMKGEALRRLERNKD